jgi:mono/diheme cytochrome c family protein
MPKITLIFISYLFFSCQNQEEINFEQYQIAGEKLYIQHCSNCHGAEGEGLRDLYPPIKNSDFLNNKNQVICVIKNGAKGPMIVNGKEYNQVMPKNKELFDLDIAQITTYIYSKWGEEKVITEVDSVKYIKCEIAF